MKPQDSLKKIGQKVREQRRAMKLSQAESAALSGVGTRFLSELENGKASLHLGKVLQVLNGMGLEIEIKPRKSNG